MTVVKVPVKSHSHFIYAIGNDPAGLTLKKDLLMSEDPSKRGKGKLNDAIKQRGVVIFLYVL
jgi:hypothetical protein